MVLTPKITSTSGATADSNVMEASGVAWHGGCRLENLVR